jgi:hypothetical protein
MINREDMLELTRRMTPKRTSISRIAGCYFDREGDFDGSFNTSFLKLSPAEKEKNLAIAKTIPYSESNRNLKEYRFPKSAMGAGSVWQLLKGLRSCELKNDALMDTFYDLTAEYYCTNGAYAVYMFYGSYDIPVRGSDKAEMWDSEEVYNYLICAICPVTGDYEPGRPECGFLFPAFSDRSGDLYSVDVYNANPDRPHREIIEQLLGCNEAMLF